MLLREKALEKALSYEGEEEVPRNSNSGKFVTDCLKTVGLPTGNSWCMAFLFRCYKEASIEIGVKNPMYKTGGVLNCLNNSENIILKENSNSENILPGYQFIYNHGRGFGHTGLVIKINDDGSFETIEGNTDPEGSRNGYGVFRRTRNLSDIKLQAFICY